MMLSDSATTGASDSVFCRLMPPCKNLLCYRFTHRPTAIELVFLTV